MDVTLKMPERPKHLVGERVQELLEWKHSCCQALSLVARSMLLHPGAHHLLLLCMDCFRLCPPLRSRGMAKPHICLESAQRLWRNLLQKSGVPASVEVHGPTIGHYLAATAGRCGMDDRASGRVSYEIKSDLIPPLVERLPLGGLAR